MKNVLKIIGRILTRRSALQVKSDSALPKYLKSLTVRPRERERERAEHCYVWQVARPKSITKTKTAEKFY